jgi:hypothetical protein
LAAAIANAANARGFSQMFVPTQHVPTPPLEATPPSSHHLGSSMTPEKSVLNRINAHPVFLKTWMSWAGCMGTVFLLFLYHEEFDFPP